MQINSEDSKSSLVISPIELDQWGCIRIDVAVSTKYFQGKTRNAYVEVRKLEEFVKSLEELDNTSTGGGTLIAMSPEELKLTISAIDMAGHVFLTVQLGKYAYNRSDLIIHSVNTGFEIERAELRRSIRDFRDILQGKLGDPDT